MPTALAAPRPGFGWLAFEEERRSRDAHLALACRSKQRAALSIIIAHSAALVLQVHAEKRKIIYLYHVLLYIWR